MAHQHHLHGPGAEHAGPQAGKAGNGGDAVVTVAGHLVERERGGDHAGEGGRLGEPLAFGAGSATGAGPPRWRQPVQACVGAQPGGDGDLLGEAAQRLAGVGAVQDQVDAARTQVLADHPDQLDGEAEPSRSVPGLPQASQDRQADGSVWDERQVHQHAHDDPVVCPGDPVAAGR